MSKQNLENSLASIIQRINDFRYANVSRGKIKPLFERGLVVADALSEGATYERFKRLEKESC
jgi:hypothetical protein